MAIGSNDWEGVILANGRYLITAKLGEGGMGFVYRAQDRNIEADVVIKIPRQAMMDDPEFAGRFTREIRSLVKLSHPHIVKVTDVGEWEGTPFAVMQYLPGGSLEDQRTVGPDGQALPCDPRKLSGWLVAVAEALDYIHVQGYVHRDVKPGNILFDALGHAFLSDFGVAKVLASSTSNSPPAPSQTAMTGAGMVLGTPEYMAPELIMGETFDGRADQYALAITVYEMLCGRRPFEDGTKTKLLVLHTSKAPPRLTEWCPTLPERLSQTVLKALNKDPNERYPRCIDLARAVVAVADGVVARDDRVRLKCPGCGKTGSMAAVDFAKLKASGKPATCPACKTPIDIATADRVASGAGPGGTMQFSALGSSNPYKPASDPAPAAGGTTALSSPAGSGGHGVPGVSQPAHGGTMALSAASTVRQQAIPIANSPPPTRRGSGTIVERVLPRSAEAAGTAVLTSVASAELDGPELLTLNESAAKSKRTPIPVQIQVAVGAGAAALLLLVTFVVFQLMPGHETKSAAPEPTAKGAVNASRPDSPNRPAEQPSQPSPPEPSTADTRRNSPTKLAGAPDPGPKPGDQAHLGEPTPSNPPSRSADTPATTKREEGDTEAHPVALAPERNAAVKSKRVEAAASTFASGRFNVARLEDKPVSAKVTLEKILRSSRSFSNQIVIPAGMYNLAPSQTDQPGGLRKWLATERNIGAKKNSSALELTLSPASDLELEPQLAAHLENLPPRRWKDKMAILTLWIRNDGATGLVKAEFLERAIPTIRKVGYAHKGFIEYETLHVTPQGTKPAKGNEEIWEQVGRMNTFALHYKNSVKGYQRMLHDNEQAKLSAQMNTMFGQMMRDAAVQEQQQRQLQRALGGR